MKGATTHRSSGGITGPKGLPPRTPKGTTASGISNINNSFGSAAANAMTAPPAAITAPDGSPPSSMVPVMLTTFSMGDPSSAGPSSPMYLPSPNILVSGGPSGGDYSSDSTDRALLSSTHSAMGAAAGATTPRVVTAPAALSAHRIAAAVTSTTTLTPSNSADKALRSAAPSATTPAHAGRRASATPSTPRGASNVKRSSTSGAATSSRYSGRRGCNPAALGSSQLLSRSFMMALPPLAARFCFVIRTLCAAVRFLRPLRAARRDKAEKRRRHKAAFVIQCAWRRRLHLRRIFVAMAVRRIGRHLSANLRRKVRAKHAAAARIQRVYRTYVKQSRFDKAEKLSMRIRLAIWRTVAHQRRIDRHRHEWVRDDINERLLVTHRYIREAKVYLRSERSERLAIVQRAWPVLERRHHRHHGGGGHGHGGGSSEGGVVRGGHHASSLLRHGAVGDDHHSLNHRRGMPNRAAMLAAPLLEDMEADFGTLLTTAADGDQGEFQTVEGEGTELLDDLFSRSEANPSMPPTNTSSWLEASSSSRQSMNNHNLSMSMSQAASMVVDAALKAISPRHHSYGYGPLSSGNTPLSATNSTGRASAAVGSAAAGGLPLGNPSSTQGAKKSFGIAMTPMHRPHATTVAQHLLRGQSNLKAIYAGGGGGGPTLAPGSPQQPTSTAAAVVLPTPVGATTTAAAVSPSPPPLSMESANAPSAPTTATTPPATPSSRRLLAVGGSSSPPLPRCGGAGGGDVSPRASSHHGGGSGGATAVTVNRSVTSSASSPSGSPTSHSHMTPLTPRALDASQRGGRGPGAGAPIGIAAGGVGQPSSPSRSPRPFASLLSLYGRPSAAQGSSPPGVGPGSSTVPVEATNLGSMSPSSQSIALKGVPAVANIFSEVTQPPSGNPGTAAEHHIIATPSLLARFTSMSSLNATGDDRSGGGGGVVPSSQHFVAFGGPHPNLPPSASPPHVDATDGSVPADAASFGQPFTPSLLAFSRLEGALSVPQIGSAMSSASQLRSGIGISGSAKHPPGGNNSSALLFLHGSSSSGGAHSQPPLPPPPPLPLDDVELAYAELLEQAERLNRKQLQNIETQHRSDMEQRYQWCQVVIVIAPRVPTYFRPLLLQVYPVWRLVRCVRLIQDEMDARAVLLDQAACNAPVLLLQDQRKAFIIAEEPSISKPTPVRVSNVLGVRGGGNPYPGGGGGDGMEGCDGEERAAGRAAAAFGDTLNDLDDDVRSRRRHRRFTVTRSLAISSSDGSPSTMGNVGSSSPESSFARRPSARRLSMLQTNSTSLRRHFTAVPLNRSLDHDISNSGGGRGGALDGDPSLHSPAGALRSSRGSRLRSQNAAMMSSDPQASSPLSRTTSEELFALASSTSAAMLPEASGGPAISVPFSDRLARAAGQAAVSADLPRDPAIAGLSREQRVERGNRRRSFMQQMQQGGGGGGGGGSGSPSQAFGGETTMSYFALPPTRRLSVRYERPEGQPDAVSIKPVLRRRPPTNAEGDVPSSSGGDGGDRLIPTKPTTLGSSESNGGTGGGAVMRRRVVMFGRDGS